MWRRVTGLASIFFVTNNKEETKIDNSNPIQQKYIYY